MPEVGIQLYFYNQITTRLRFIIYHAFGYIYGMVHIFRFMEYIGIDGFASNARRAEAQEVSHQDFGLF